MELREMLQAKGFRFHSETDTEVIVHLLDMYYTGDGNLKDTVLKTLAVWRAAMRSAFCAPTARSRCSSRATAVR